MTGDGQAAGWACMAMLLRRSPSRSASCSTPRTPTLLDNDNPSLKQTLTQCCSARSGWLPPRAAAAAPSQAWERRGVARYSVAVSHTRGVEAIAGTGHESRGLAEHSGFEVEMGNLVGGARTPVGVGEEGGRGSRAAVQRTQRRSNERRKNRETAAYKRVGGTNLLRATGGRADRGSGGLQLSAAADRRALVSRRAGPGRAWPIIISRRARSSS